MQIDNSIYGPIPLVAPVSVMYDRGEFNIVGWRYAYPTYGPCGLPLIYSPCWLKLPVLVASKSLRRSRKAGAARMDAG